MAQDDEFNDENPLVKALGKAIADAEAAELFTTPEDAFAVVLMASTSYVHDKDTDMSESEQFSLDLIDAVRQVANGHQRGEIAFALIAVITAIVSGFRRPGPEGTVLTKDMIAEARTRLMMHIVDAMTREGIAGIVVGLEE